MAKKKDDVDLDFEDEDEDAEDDEYGDEDEGDDEDAEFDEDEEDDEEEGGKKGGGGAVKVMLLVILFLGALGAGAFAFMSSGGSLDFLADVPVVGQYFAKPKPVSFTPPSGFVNPNLATRQPATGSTAGETGGMAAAPPAVPGAATAAAPAGAVPGAPPQVAAQPGAAPGAKPPAPAAKLATPPPAAVSQPETPEEPTTVAEAPVRKVSSKRSRVRDTRHQRRSRDTRQRRAWRTAGAWAPESGNRRGGYTVQVGSFAQPANAERLIASLKSQGFPAFGTGGGSRGAMVHGGQFHVRSNVVDSRQKANQLANQFRLAGWSPRVVPLSGGQYVLHLGTFGNQEQASGLVADLNAKGLFATVSGRVGARVGAPPTSSGPNRVWVGQFGNRSEAEAMASRLRSSVGAAIVVRR